MRNQVAPCGTIAGYDRHLNYKEVTCRPCRDAINIYQMERKVKASSRLALARKAFLADKALDV